jgi:hypothetical protein
MRSCKLFCPGYLKLWSFWSQPPMYLGMTGACYCTLLLVKVGFCELFTWADLNLPSSRSQLNPTFECYHLVIQGCSQVPVVISLLGLSASYLLTFVKAWRPQEASVYCEAEFQGASFTLHPRNVLTWARITVKLALSVITVLFQSDFSLITHLSSQRGAVKWPWAFLGYN